MNFSNLIAPRRLCRCGIAMIRTGWEYICPNRKFWNFLKHDKTKNGFILPKIKVEGRRRYDI